MRDLANELRPVHVDRRIDGGRLWSGVPHIKQLGWGRTIQLSSVVGVQPFAAQPDYSAAKAAVINITVSLAKELANGGITVNTVTPGPISRRAGWNDDRVTTSDTTQTRRPFAVAGARL